MRINYQCLVWKQAIYTSPALPSPEEYGWVKREGKLEEGATTLLPAPDVIVNLIKCNCNKSKCPNLQCNCRRTRLNCTDLCGCSLGAEFDCENSSKPDTIDSDEDEDDDDESSDMEF